MPRIRYLKPDFFRDEDIAELPPLIRIFFEGLWCFADKAGRLEDRPKRLKADIMPYEADFDAEHSLEILNSPKKNSPAGKPFIQRYEVDGERYIQILSWNKHQKPHHTETESVIPPAPPYKEKEKDKDKDKGKMPLSPFPNGDITVKEPLKNNNGECDIVEVIEKIMVSWNEFAKKNGLSVIRDIEKGSSRERNLLARIKSNGFNFDELLSKIEKQPFLMGDSDKGWRVSFDWIILPRNYTKIVEEQYLRKTGGQEMSEATKKWLETPDD